jgi:hypothetical protein
MTMNVDDEWQSFISNENQSEDYENYEDNNEDIKDKGCISANIQKEVNYELLPKASPIYISTTTKIAYLNTPIDLQELFWKTPTLSYMEVKNGIIKKEMKFNSETIEEVESIQEKLSKEKYGREQIITNINNPNGRIKFKDVRKISVGICKKDILSYRSKVKSAFYNCFVIILRMKIEETFKEFHVKIFNTGKLEIPGIQSEKCFSFILDEVIRILQPFVKETLEYKPNSSETVLINSNFNCGFYINREVLHDILKYKYKIQSIYDPCSYPGIQSKFYFNPDVKEQKGWQISQEEKNTYKNVSKVSFMIFRTGSILISGKCDENVLNVIYEYLKNLLLNEYDEIAQPIILAEQIAKDKKKKSRRKNIAITMEL